MIRFFPATEVALGPNRQFAVTGLKKVHWSNATPIRKVFREAFVNAGLPYFNPHSFRDTLTRPGQERCRTPEEFKSWSQNFGHEQVLTTLVSYGEVAYQRQGEIISELGTPPEVSPLNQDVDEIAEALFEKFRKSGVRILADGETSGDAQT